MTTQSEENYIKAIFHLTGVKNESVSTNAIAEEMETKASSVTDMIKKLSDKDLVKYKKYQGVQLTEKGRLLGAKIIRKHRLWEVFLVEKLNFSWDEVHDVAEQLEHIKSEKLVEELDSFLEFPKVDPHGDPIPDKNGKIRQQEKVLLSACKLKEKGLLVGVKNSSSEFLQYLDKIKIALGDVLEIIEKEPFDNSMIIKTRHGEINISALIANNIFIKKL
ncbi:metal-dependent transcriptional regulator [Abyssalbus ytuae]|uniref:Transcriptional regulator MntR n=1 Tax=Abyssalbus ytuae TaxID=2926907 RepID=A0A9E6ZQC6_9FLAO|nr:metal-dependent transcriptional regulator [Abyssalbus ytuae]UOB15973.1 metal-dependent transcriptional regulator [Abyssalbus ytuae]